LGREEKRKKWVLMFFTYEKEEEEEEELKSLISCEIRDSRLFIEAFYRQIIKY
jgi:hypothetical protein